MTPREPRILPEPAPAHAKNRWRAIQQLHDGKPDDAVHSIDAADAVHPICTVSLTARSLMGSATRTIALPRCSSIPGRGVCLVHMGRVAEGGLRQPGPRPIGICVRRLLR